MNVCNIKKSANINEYNASAKGSLSLVTTIHEQRLTYLLSQKTLNIEDITKCKNQDIFYKNILNNTPIILLFKRIIAEKDNISNPKNIYNQIYELLTEDTVNFNTIYSKYLAHAIKPSEYKMENTYKESYKILTNNGKSSNELNSSLFEYFYTDLPIFETIKKSSLSIITNFIKKNEFRDKLTVFHGTNMKVHETTNTFTTYAFLSTTVDLNVARSYGEIIYIINISPGFPYINLGDDCNKQILLPIGTQVTIEKFSIKDKIYFGTISVAQNIMQTLKTIKCVLDQPTIVEQILKVEDLTNIDLKNTPSKQVNTQPIKKRKCSPCTTKFCKGASTIKFYTNNIQYALKFGQHADDNYNIRRMINEVFASRLYKYLDMNAFDHEIKKTTTTNNSIHDNKYCIQSEFKNIKYRDPIPIEAEEYLKNYLWDCILANWDVGNKGNVGFLDDKIIIRTDVGGALAYRARGEFKLSFFNNSTPKEHIFLLQQPFVKKCFSLIDKNNLVTLLYTNITNDKLNALLNTVQNEPIQTYINSLPPQYQNFITKIIDNVIRRYTYYNNEQNRVNIIEQIISALKPLQQGGKNSLFLKYNSEIYKIKTLKTDKYILVKNKRVFLKDIRGKYRYVKSGGGEDNVEVEDIDDEEYILYDSVQPPQATKTLEELLQEKKHCALPNNK